MFQNDKIIIKMILMWNKKSNEGDKWNQYYIYIIMYMHDSSTWITYFLGIHDMSHIALSLIIKNYRQMV